MPEIPEIRAHAARLVEAFGGQRLERFTAVSFTVLKSFEPRPDLAVGSPLLGVRQRGKYLLLDFEPVTHVVHLMQGGRLVIGAPEPVSGGRKRPPKPGSKAGGVQAIWDFGPVGTLKLTERGTEHRTGIWTAVPGGDPPSELGPDADSLSAAELTAVLRAHSGRLHNQLRDQRIVAGVGRRLANEVCHRAKLSPFARTKTLTDEEGERLHQALADCIADSMAFEATQHEMVASTHRPAAVHRRVGEACPVCGTAIASVDYNAYQVAYCPTCQTGGKILADNTTSKFLK